MTPSFTSVLGDESTRMFRLNSSDVWVRFVFRSGPRPQSRDLRFHLSSRTVRPKTPTQHERTHHRSRGVKVGSVPRPNFSPPRPSTDGLY